MTIRRIALGLVFALVALATAARGAPPRVHALTGARLVIGPGEVVESGTLVLRDGVIEAVGAGVEIPADARLWEREGLTIYPGLIESHLVRSWPEQDAKIESDGGHPNPLVRPERDMLRHASDEKAAAKLRGAGFTSAVVVPKEGLFRGRSVLMNLGDGSANDNLLRRGVAQNAALARNSFDGGYPASLMGAIALFRQTLLDSAWHEAAHAAYQRNPAQSRPPASTALSALHEVTTGRERLVFETDDLADTLRAAALISEFELDAVLVGSGEEYRRLGVVSAIGLPIILPLDHPALPELGDEDDLSLGLEELRHWDQAPENPSRLLAAGVEVVFTSHRLDDPRKLLAHVSTSIERGLDRDAALAALTTRPAELFDIDDRAGTLEAGKMANLVLVEGELFDEKPKIKEVWVDGRRYEIQESEPAEVEPAGTWKLTVVTGDGQELPARLEVTGRVPALEGTINVGEDVGLPVTSIEVSGSTLRVSFDGTPLGMPGSIDFEMDIEGDSASGSGNSPSGPFSLTANRTAKPSPELRS